jgi:hypothetical protein
MCQYRILKVRRALKNTEKVVLLHEDNLNRILSGPLFSILLSDRWEETGISRSYYYSGLKTLRELRLIEDNAIAFKVALAYRYERNCLRLLSDKLAFVSKGRIVISMGLSERPNCLSCELLTECIYGLKLIKTELRLKSTSVDPHERWIENINEIEERLKRNDVETELVLKKG